MNDSLNSGYSIKDNNNSPVTAFSIRGLVQAKQDHTEVNRYISREFQDYGYDLASRLEDASHAGLYIKLAKTLPRTILERAYSFVADYPRAKNKGKLFMWKIKQIRTELKAKAEGIV